MNHWILTIDPETWYESINEILPKLKLSYFINQLTDVKKVKTDIGNDFSNSHYMALTQILPSLTMVSIHYGPILSLFSLTLGLCVLQIVRALPFTHPCSSLFPSFRPPLLHSVSCSLVTFLLNLLHIFRILPYTHQCASLNRHHSLSSLFLPPLLFMIEVMIRSEMHRGRGERERKVFITD